MNGMLNYLLKCKIVNYFAQLPFIVFKSNSYKKSEMCSRVLLHVVP